jgi:multicomponent K+:H+ antiporter subunit G
VNDDLPRWVELTVAGLLVVSGLIVVIAAGGIVRFEDSFQRMHSAAIVSTGSSWCLAVAAILLFSSLEHRAVLHPWLIPVVLAVTVPVTSVLLARVTLFRRRVAQEPGTPEPLSRAAPARD